jgi:hypothetical protein
MRGKSSGGSVATDEGSVVATVARERDVPMHNASQIVGPTSTHFGGPLDSGFEPKAGLKLGPLSEPVGDGKTRSSS